MRDEIESKTKGFDNMKKMRMLSMLLALLLVFSLSLSVLADDAAKITVESWTEDANAGDEVTLAVSVENNPGFLSAVWEIGYDSSKLALQSINTAYNVESEGKTREITYLSGIYAPNPKKMKVSRIARITFTTISILIIAVTSIKIEACNILHLFRHSTKHGLISGQIVLKLRGMNPESEGQQ